jgi:predicted nucleotidyltransferase
MIAYPETLKELLGVKVDVVSRRGIKPRIRERALQEVILYERPKGQSQKA